MKALEYYREILEKAGVTLPQGVVKNEEHYFSKLYIARVLRDLEYNKEAYSELAPLLQYSLT